MKPRAILAGLIAIAACLSEAGAREDASNRPIVFSPEEIGAILRHGPWPSARKPDASNRVSGKSAAIVFGEKLFFDTRLSSSGNVSCASCHIPERGFSDGRKLAVGLEEIDRHTPGLLNVRLNRWFGWDGTGDSLWAQSIRPVIDTREMGMSIEKVAALIRADPDLACHYRRSFGVGPSKSDDDAVLVGAGKALAAFQETISSGRAPFDEFRDALARGDRKTMARYPATAQRGAKIFVGKGRCNLCHFGPNFSNGEFEEIGIPHYMKNRQIDWGRGQGIKLLLSNRFNLLSHYNDDTSGTSAESTRHVALALRNYGEFKIPSLRNVALTAPYMHNGHLATLRDVVRHYSEIDPNQLHLGPEFVDEDGAAVNPGFPTLLKPLNLSESEIDDLIAFLESLTGKVNSARTTEAMRRCRP